MLNKNKKIFLVGCGKRGSSHLRAMVKFEKIPDAFCDFNDETIDLLSKEYKNSEFFTDIESLTNDIKDSCDNFAVIAVDAKNNYQTAKVLLENNVNVLMEKPPGLSMGQAKELLKISKEKKLQCFIGFDRRFNPFVTKSIELLSEYGQIFNIQAEFNKDINEWVDHRAFDDNLLDKMVLESPIHSIDLMNHLSNSDIKKVSGSSSRIGSKYRTSFSGLVEYKNGCTGTINSSYLSSGRLERYSIHAEKCSIYLDGINSGKIFYNSKIFDIETDTDLTSTELQMENYLASIYDKETEFVGTKIEEALNIFKITEKMFENTYT